MWPYKCTLAIAIIGMFFSSHGAAAQQRGRIVRQMSEGVEAVRISSVEVGGAPVEVGKKFPANKTWLKGLKIKTLNLSDKSVVGVLIELSVDPPGFDGVVYTIPYGVIPRSQGEAGTARKVMRPNEPMEVTLSGPQYESLRSLLEQTGYYGEVDEITVTVGAVFFDDYTLWRHGRELRPSPEDPRKWTVVGPYGRAAASASPARPQKRVTPAPPHYTPVNAWSASGVTRFRPAGARQQMCDKHYEDTFFLECAGTTSSTGGPCIFVRDVLSPTGFKDALEIRRTKNCTQVVPETCIVTTGVTTSIANFSCDQ